MQRMIRRLWPRSQTRRAMIVIAIALLLIISLFAGSVILGNIEKLSGVKDLSSVFQAGVAVIAIVAGGIIALFRLEAYRDFEPHVDVTHETTYRIMNDTYAHINVRTTLHNTSKVKVEFTRAIFSVQRVLPMSNEEIERIHDQVFLFGERKDLQWPILSLVEYTWNPEELIVEPGQKHSETQEFIVQLEVSSMTVKVLTYFYDERRQQPPNDQKDATAEFGWQAVTFLDIV